MIESCNFTGLYRSAHGGIEKRRAAKLLVKLQQPLAKINLYINFNLGSKKYHRKLTNTIKTEPLARCRSQEPIMPPKSQSTPTRSLPRAPSRMYGKEITPMVLGRGSYALPRSSSPDPYSNHIISKRNSRSSDTRKRSLTLLLPQE